MVWIIAISPSPVGGCGRSFFGKPSECSRSVHLLDHLAVSQVHVHSARQAWVKAANCTHDIDALKVGWSVFFENRRVLDRVFVRPRSAVDIARIGVPASRGIRMVVGHFTAPDHEMMREYSSDRLMETASNRFIRNLEGGEGVSSASVQLFHRLFDKIWSGRCRISL